MGYICDLVKRFEEGAGEKARAFEDQSHVSVATVVSSGAGGLTMTSQLIAVAFCVFWGVIALAIVVRVVVALARRRRDRVRAALAPVFRAGGVQSEAFGFRPTDSDDVVREIKESADVSEDRGPDDVQPGRSTPT